MGPRTPLKGPATIENVSESPSASLPLSVIVTVVSSFVDADASFATGGVLQVTRITPAGSDGVAGEQAPVVVAGQGPVGDPFTGNEVPVVVTVPQAVSVIVPWSEGGSPDAEPVGRTSPRPLVQMMLPE